jgi:putative ABC transport system permease protein
VLVSLATEFADGVGIQVGDRLVFDVAGESVAAQVANLRKVQWDSFRPNFFVLVSPGALDGAAGTYMTSVHLDTAQRRMLAPLVRRFPGVSVFDVDAILVQVRQVADRASRAVQGVFLFTLAAGVMVLAAAVQSTRDERRFESAMLRTLGASRAVVLKGLLAEFVALGLLAGVLASTAAALAGWYAARHWFNLAYHFNAWLWIAGLCGGAVVVGVAGWLATRSVVNTSPLATLRG